MSVLVNRMNTNSLVYIMKFSIDEIGKDCYKIGITSRGDETLRLSEICMSFFSKFRYVPRTSLVKFSKCNNALEAETRLHSYYKDFNLKFSKNFNGSTEFFMIEDIDRLVEVYKDALDGVDINADTYKYARL